MSIKLGINNAKGSGGNGGGGSIEITKSYTIGYSEAQALLSSGLNQGIDSHCIVEIGCSQSTITTNAILNTSGTGSTATSISDSMRYGRAGIYALGGTITFGDNQTSNAGFLSPYAFTDGDGNTRYGYKGVGESATTIDGTGTTIKVYAKPYVLGTIANPTNTSSYLKGSLKILVWDTTSNEYKTVEWSDVSNSAGSSTNAFKYNGYLYFNISRSYLICGILEASITPVVSNNGTYTWIEPEDLEGMLA